MKRRYKSRYTLEGEKQEVGCSNTMPSNSTLLGAAGEHYVLSQLLRRGYIAALAPIGLPNADIVVTSDLYATTP